MSITRGVEVRKKDGTYIDGDQRNVSWKNLDFDMWVSNYLFRVQKIVKLKGTRRSWDDFTCPIPKEVLLAMGEELKNRNFGICLDFEDYFDDDEAEYAQGYGESFIDLGNDELAEDEEFVYYDGGC